MLSPVVVPKPKRLLSPRTGFELCEEKKQDSGEPSDKMFIFDPLRQLPSGGVHEASLEVERILLALEDSERDQKSPRVEDPRDTYVQDSPPLRAISPPARSQNPQAEAIEAMWREHPEPVDSLESLPTVFDDFGEGEDEVLIEQFQQISHRPTRTQRLQAHSLTEPSSPYSAPLSAPLYALGLSRRNSIPGDEDDDQDQFIHLDSAEDGDIVFISPPEGDYEIEQTSARSLHEDFQEDEDLPTEPESCPLTIQITGPPLSMRRFQSLPGSGPSSGPSSATGSSKRKRGKPKYETRSLPCAVGCDLVLTMQRRRQVRTMSDTVKAY